LQIRLKSISDYFRSITSGLRRPVPLASAVVHAVNAAQVASQCQGASSRVNRFLASTYQCQATGWTGAQVPFLKSYERLDRESNQAMVGVHDHRTTSTLSINKL